MNDRFKCRVWDKENKCMHYPTRYSNFAIVNGTVVKIESYPTANSAYLGKRIAWEFDDAVIMQCTGLKDNNGKLIYEGDVVIYTTIYSGNLTGVVYWDSETLQYKLKLLYSSGEIYANRDLTHFVNKNNIEVIGNIYENKELLESEDNQ